jgi:transposase
MRRVECPIEGGVLQEQPEWMAKTRGYTKRFAYYVGKRCQESTITDVAKELHLNWKTVKALEMEYMEEKLRRAGPVRPHVIGIDELSVRKGHSYRIVVSDLEQRRPIWYGGIDRSMESLNMFYDLFKPRQRKGIRLAVMDMWKPFEKSTMHNAPNAAILYDKFHVIRHLNDALDKVRRSEYHRVSDKEKKFIKGQRYTLLSAKENLTVDGRQSLRLLLKANKRLNVAHVLKESFSQLWDYKSETWALKFFQNWKSSLKWQRLKQYEKFANMIEKHWEGIAAHCRPENQIPLGFVEGLNNKIRVIQRRSYGIRDEEYFRLKILTCMLPEFT